jgi:HD-like signal output (HDOD) protein
MPQIASGEVSVKRILFVDDDPSVLDALRNILRKQRNEWEMVFSIGAEAALEEMRDKSFDVIVSDMRMPGIDGADLLGKVRHQSPATARIVLSGHAEHEAVIRALPVMHQFLSKPCSNQELRSVIARTCALQDFLHTDTIREVVGSIVHLPSPPGVYLELTRALADPKADASKMARIVEADPAMSAKLLQLVNSAYFALSKPARTVQHAVSYLGTSVLKALALSTQVFGTVEGATSGRVLERLQRDALSTATLARRIVRDGKRGDEAFTAGIVRDIGRLVIAAGLPERFAEIETSARASGRALHHVERECLGATHAEIGAYLLGVWGVPFTITETVAFHHQPSAVSAGN